MPASNPRETTAAVSAVVLTWNSARYIERCLRSLQLAAAEARLSLKVLVVDGGSADDGTLDVLARLEGEFDNLRVISLARNLGTTVSRNLALKQAKANLLLMILDSDTEVPQGTLGVVCRALLAAPRAGVVAPRLLYPDGTVQYSCKRFPTLPLKVCKFVPLPILQELAERSEIYPSWVYEAGAGDAQPIRVDHCISACWLLRREAMAEVGLLQIVVRIRSSTMAWVEARR